MNQVFFYLFFLGVAFICIGDFLTGLIRNKYVFPLMIFGLVYIPFNPFVTWKMIFLSTLMMIILLLLMYHSQLIGGGDVKLFIALSLMIGIHAFYVFALQGILALLWKGNQKSISFQHVRAGLFILVSTIIILLLYFI